ncbi:IclR family transcriptional regulator [Rhodovulum euryhalinum]|uniref:IclR family transcriptional regulator n=1 Tax=Rhodovulum euryhalinum TaxID=35805 RepID=A0A4R2KJQ0_9RHOB|nr:IclR family transcriptional regulator [Rhodovulum euryhalinum]TCO70839.1 IclR family transcriptional regulator [Rhodovulum euryhalinum]
MGQRLCGEDIVTETARTHAVRQDGPAGLAAGGASDASADKGARRIQSVERALTIIEILAAAPDALALGEVAARAGLNVSTCHHLIATLVERGYVLNAGRNRGYMLSSRLQELTETNARKADLSDFARTDLIGLSGQLGLSVQLAEMQGAALVTRFKANVAETHVIEADEVVKMRAAHATATGKAILAWLPEDQVLKIISENGLQRFTDRTITSLADLTEELRWVRRNGFAVDNEELKTGVVCYGAALRDEKGAVIASISASMPVALATEPCREHVAQEVVGCARKLSDRLRLSRH